QDFITDLMTFYSRKLGGFVILAFAVSVAALGVARLAGILHGSNSWISPWSMLGFSLLVWGLWNVSLLFGCSAAPRAAAAAAAGCIADRAVGYVASRLGSYHYAVIGFAAGGAVFALASTLLVLAAFRQLDHRYLTA